MGIVIPDISEFVTQQDIDEAIAAIKFPETDLSLYALKSELPNIDGLASEIYVQEKVDEILNSIPSFPTYDEFICDGGEI